MLTYTEWREELNKLDKKLKELNFKRDYRTLQILGPEPTTDFERGLRQRSYGRTSEEFTALSSDLVFNKIQSEYEFVSKQKDYLKRTGCKLDDIDTDEAFK